MVNLCTITTGNTMYYCYHPSGRQPTRPWSFRVPVDTPLVLMGVTPCNLDPLGRHPLHLCSYFPTARGNPRSEDSIRSHHQLLTTTRNQGRGVKNHPEDDLTPLKSSKKYYILTIKVTINPLKLLQQPCGGLTIFRHC